MYLKDFANILYFSILCSLICLILTFQDVVILDQTLILAGSDLHDRHRDMRLDVDNMSYEV